MNMPKALTHQQSVNTAPMMPMEGVVPTVVPRVTETFSQGGFLPDMWKDSMYIS